MTHVVAWTKQGKAALEEESSGGRPFALHPDLLEDVIRDPELKYHRQALEALRSSPRP